MLNLYYKLFNKYRVIRFKERTPAKIMILGMIRVRNEELIIEDTLNHLSEFCDAIICFDDASYDNTCSILEKYEKVVAIIRNFNWQSGSDERLESETTHRQALLTLAGTYNPEWIFYADADERYVGDIRGFVESDQSKDIDLVRISLFDAYLTEQDFYPYEKGQKLLGFRKYFGPERRDIVMLWRAKESIVYVGKDSREPKYPSHLKVTTMFYCQHYGKSLSVEHWEETCNYYLNHFPYESYGRKWESRIGKAIHTKSDFDTPLYLWGKELFENAILIYPFTT